MAGRAGAPVPSGVVASDAFPPIRRLGPGDLSRCVALSVDRGWSPERAKWSLLLECSEGFGVDAPDETASAAKAGSGGRRLAGAVVLTRWGSDLASVGMMLVAARYARRGLGRALMEHVLAAAGDATVTLFATDMGRPLYERLGFAPVRRSVSFTGTFRPGPPAALAGRTRAAVEEDLPSILAVDQAAFGADRGRVLTRLAGVAENLAVLAPEQGISGYAAAWRNLPSSAIIGPLVAPDPEAAKALIAYLAARTPGPIRLDLDPDRPELPGWAHARGLEPVARTTVMARGELAQRGAPSCLFTPISVALA
jgi:GNAT superfamily N-acetyltransferase